MYHFLIDNRHDSRSLFQRNYLERINIQLLLQITFDERNVSINKKKKEKEEKFPPYLNSQFSQLTKYRHEILVKRNYRINPIVSSEISVTK